MPSGKSQSKVTWVGHSDLGNFLKFMLALVHFGWYLGRDIANAEVP
jgi:hypothetical protein